MASEAPTPTQYTASSIFLLTLARAGITHVFVNWGSDHPALVEDIARQVASPEGTVLKVVTCPNEMVALTAAQGFAQGCGKPAAVIVHVDVGTQALAGAVHNADRGRVPVLIYAGASPWSNTGEVKGSRNEWIMWMQDVPDQSAIVRQYMRYTAQIHSSKHISQVIHRALQTSTSNPKGPSYIWARREVMEENVTADEVNKHVEKAKWPAVSPAALSAKDAEYMSTALLTARKPLFIVGHLGRSPGALNVLCNISMQLAIPIIGACSSAVPAPFSHPYFFGTAYLYPTEEIHPLLVQDADVIVVLDSDTPWLPVRGPSSSTRVFILDSGDPLRRGIGFWHIDAEGIYNCDGGVALQQIRDCMTPDLYPQTADIKERGQRVRALRQQWLDPIEAAEEQFADVNPKADKLLYYTLPQIVSTFRRQLISRFGLGGNFVVLNEGITNYGGVWHHMRPEKSGQMITSGGSSLGWSLGAAVGVSLAGNAEGKKHDLVAVIVGDGSFIFGIPSASYWMARKYEAPFVTIVLNNGGWKAPKMSAAAVYPDGHAARGVGHEISTGFGPYPPDFAQLAVAATSGWAWAARVEGGDRANLESKIEEAIRICVEEKRCAVLECILEPV